MQPPPDGSLLIFAGSADISTRNMNRQLEHWLPKHLEIDPPVIQASIPDEYLGLRKVHDWLDSQFSGDGEYEEVDDLTEFIDTMETSEDIYLVVLWGKGGDEDTEKLVDLAIRRNIQVLDLTDGLDKLVLGERAPAPEAPARRTRRTRTPAADDDTATAAPEQAGNPRAGNDLPPWRTDDEEKPAEDLAEQVTRTVAKMLGTVFTSIGSAFLQQSAEDKAPEASAAEPAERAGNQAAETTARRPAGTRAWLQDPADPAKFKLRGRGQPRGEYRAWKVHFLTPEQEADRGLEA